MTPRTATDRRKLALALLFTAGALNIFDRQIVNILAQDIKHDLAITDAQLGLLTGTAFGVFYSILGIPLGRLADRIDRIKLIAAALVFWSGFTALCGSAATFTQLFLLRMGVGVGEAGSQPASAALIADLFAEDRRTAAMSALLIGAPVGGFLALSIGGYVASTWGWRAAFLIAGIPGLILSVLMLATLRDPRRTHAGAVRMSSASIFAALREFAANPRFGWTIAAMACFTFLVYASGAWLPVFFIRVYGMTTARIGAFSAVAVGLGGALGALGSGIACDALRVRIQDVESKLLTIALCLAVPTALGTVLGANLAIAFSAMFLLNICIYAWLGPLVTLVQNEAPPDSRALAVAIGMAFSNVLSLGVGLPLVGLMSDALGPGYGAPAVGYALAIAIVAAAIIGAFSLWKARAAPLAVQRAALWPKS